MSHYVCYEYVLSWRLHVHISRSMISGLSRETMHRHWKDSGTSLIQSPMGQKNWPYSRVTVLTRVFYKKMYGRLAGRPKKVAVITRWPYLIPRWPWGGFHGILFLEQKFQITTQNFHPSRCTGSLFLHGNNGKWVTSLQSVIMLIYSLETLF